MAIQIDIKGGNHIRLTDKSVLKWEYTIESGEETGYLEESVDTVTLIGEMDLHSGGVETIQVMMLMDWILRSSTDPECYRKVTIQIYDSLGSLTEKIELEKAFVVAYEDRFSATAGRASYVLTMRALKEKEA